MSSKTLLLACAVVLVAVVTSSNGEPMLGGLSGVSNPVTQSDPDVLVIASSPVRDAFTETTGITPKEFYVVSYASQVVRGTNYFAKIRIAEDTYVHIRVYQDLPFANKLPELLAVQLDKSLEDPIVYFDAAVDVTAVTGLDPEFFPLVGSLSDVKIALAQSDSEVIVISAQSVRDTFTKITGITPQEFHVISYATQVVRGTNYFAKVRIAPDTYVHVRVYDDLPSANKQPELTAVQVDKNLNDSIVYFDSNILPSTVAPKRVILAASGSTTFSTCLMQVALLVFFCVLLI